jgi:hypothetical protein
LCSIARAGTPADELPGNVVLDLSLELRLENAPRDLPGTESGELHLASQLGVGTAQLGLDLHWLDLDGELALDRGQLFDLDLHGEGRP